MFWPMPQVEFCQELDAFGGDALFSRALATSCCRGFRVFLLIRPSVTGMKSMSEA
jgi:hypothetical protein